MNEREKEFLEDNIATVAFHLGQPGAKLSVQHDKSGVIVDPGEVLKEISRRLSAPAQQPVPCGDYVSIRRGWLKHVIDVLAGPLPSGRIGDAVFLLRDQFQDILDKPLYTSPAQSSWQPPDGLVLVPQAAIKWLHGEGPDDNGKWFGDAEPPIKPSMPIARYWWRTTFRRMCSVTSTSGETAA